MSPAARTRRTLAAGHIRQLRNPLRDGRRGLSLFWWTPDGRRMSWSHAAPTASALSFYMRGWVTERAHLRQVFGSEVVL